MRIPRFGFLVALACAAISAAAGATFSGTWKLDLSKSRFAGQTFTIEKTPSGLYHFDSQGFGYDFDLTGKEFPAPDGGSSSWKATDANTWEAAIHMNGKTIASYHLVLKGNSLDSIMKVTRPDGTTAEQSTTNTRVSGGPGFLGKWRSGDPKGAATTLEIFYRCREPHHSKVPRFPDGMHRQPGRKRLRSDGCGRGLEASDRLRENRRELHPHDHKAERQAILHRRPYPVGRRQDAH